jgi:hypothetical protein
MDAIMNTKNRFILFLLFFSCIVALMGCEREQELTSLSGTKWKLKGIVDINTNKLTELEPKDCEECYTLAFDTDSTAFGRSIIVKFTIAVKGGFVKDCIGLGTDIGEIPNDGNYFRSTMGGVKSYTITSTELKFFNNQTDKYLLFKLVDQ